MSQRSGGSAETRLLSVEEEGAAAAAADDDHNLTLEETLRADDLQRTPFLAELDKETPPPMTPLAEAEAIAGRVYAELPDDPRVMHAHFGHVAKAAADPTVGGVLLALAAAQGPTPQAKMVFGGGGGL
jgi:hypothetical protein